MEQSEREENTRQRLLRQHVFLWALRPHVCGESACTSLPQIEEASFGQSRGKRPGSWRGAFRRTPQTPLKTAGVEWVPLNLPHIFAMLSSHIWPILPNMTSAQFSGPYFAHPRLGPPVDRLEYGYSFSVVYFGRGTLPKKRQKWAPLGVLV